MSKRAPSLCKGAAFLGCLCFLFCLLAQRSASAQEGGGLALLRDHFRARGASEVRELGKELVFEGQGVVRTLTLDRRSCIGVLAWGGEGVRDVDVSIYSRSGQMLAEDRGASPFGYARLCGAAGLSLYVSAQAYAGRGELALFLVEQAPRELGRLPELLPMAVAPGGLAAVPRAIGGVEAELSFEAPLLHEERTLAAAGYTAVGSANLLDVRGGLAQGTLLLRGGRCFRVVTFVPGARGLLAEVEGPMQHRDARSPDAELLRIALCTEADGAYLVRVRTRALRSLALVRIFEQPLAQAADAVSYGEERALLLGEARTLTKERGLALSPLGEVWLEGGGSVAWPVAATAGRCLLLLALPEQGIETELRLVDAEGVVLASNEGRHDLPALYTCPRKDQKLRVLLRGRGLPGPISLWRAEASAP